MDLVIAKNMFLSTSGDLTGKKDAMQDIIRPVSSSSMMQVDRNDIWWNMEYIFRACDEIGMLKINVRHSISFPNLFESDEDKAKKIGRAHV